MADFQFLKTYDFEENKVVIGGIAVNGYGDDGGIEYEQVEEQGEATYGADGEATFSRSNTRGLFVTLTLKETSNSIAELDQLRRAQHDSGGQITPLPYAHFDRLTGDKVASAYAVFMNHPTPSKAKNAGEREFRLWLPYAADRVQEGELNSIVL